MDHLPPLTRREDTKPADARVHEFAAPLSAYTFAAALRVTQITTTRRPGTPQRGDKAEAHAEGTLPLTSQTGPTIVGRPSSAERASASRQRGRAGPQLTQYE